MMGRRDQRVLVADDDPVTRMVMSRALRGADFDVTEAADGNDAWAVLSGASPPPWRSWTGTWGAPTVSSSAVV